MTLDADTIGGIVLLVIALLIGGVLIYFFQFRAKEGKVVVNPPSEWEKTNETLSGYVDKAVTSMHGAVSKTVPNPYTTTTTAKTIQE